jgi:hypothetical protein
VKEARGRYAVIIASRKSKRNSPVLQQMLKMLPSWLSITATDFIYSLEFFSRNCWHLASHATSEFFRSVFTQLVHVPSKPGLLFSFTIRAVTILWSFVQTFSKNLSPELVPVEVQGLACTASNFSSCSTVHFL